MTRRRQLIQDRLVDDRDDEADFRLHDDRDDGSDDEREDGDGDEGEAEPYLHRQPDGRRVIVGLRPTRRRR